MLSAIVAAATFTCALGGTAWAQDEPPDEAPAEEAPEEPGEDVAPDATGYSGRLEADGEPVAGAVIVAADADGNQVGEAVTAEDGTWLIEVPGPGTYSVTLAVDTLPDGVEMRNPDAQTLEVRVRAGQVRTLNFLLGEGASGRSDLDKLAQAATNGLKFGLIIAMASIGLSLIFGVTGLINFAHGELVTFGAAAAWYLNTAGLDFRLFGLDLDGPALTLGLAALVALAFSGVLGAGLERGLFLPLRRRRLGAFQFVVLTIGLSLLGRQLLQLWIGERRLSFRDYAFQKEWDIGPIGLTPRDATIMGIALVVLLAVAAMLQKTRTGKAMRAVSDDPGLAETSGIDVDRITTLVWVLGAMLAGLGGVLYGSTEFIEFQMGFRILLLMFAAVVLGGLGTAYGAMVGGLVIGLATEISTVWISPELKFIVALAALILILLVRPQGILGLKERVG